MSGFEQSLHIDDTAFAKMREDADMVLQKLIKNMVEKDSLEGKLSITIDLSMDREFIPNYDPNIEGESRWILIPKISHKVGSMMQIKNETKGDTNYEGMELVWDEDAGEYIMKPIANTSQRTIFDADFNECAPEHVDGEIVDEDGQPVLEGHKVAALPGPISEENEELRDEGGEATAEGDSKTEDRQEPDDISDEIFNEKDPLPFDGEDDEDYRYEEPGEEY